MMKLSIARRRMSLLSLTAAAGLWGSSVADAQNYIVPRGRAYATPYCPPTQPQYCPPGMLPPGSYPQPSPEHAPRPLPPTPSDPTPTPRRDPTPSSDPM
ncbi:MAG: hypothetical protein KDA80_16645, partial [Planctomycetaceae bacterium]|nr:hypothetical protein [Planctomycetaceae bacterium]